MYTTNHLLRLQAYLPDDIDEILPDALDLKQTNIHG